MVAEFIKQYYSQWAVVPPEILVESTPPDIELLEEFLSREGRKVRIFVPQKGEKKALLNLAQSDCIEMVKTLSEKAKSNQEKQTAIKAEIESVIRKQDTRRQTSRLIVLNLMIYQYERSRLRRRDDCI